jgi:hypothetical protein
LSWEASAKLKLADGSWGAWGASTTAPLRAFTTLQAWTEAKQSQIETLSCRVLHACELVERMEKRMDRLKQQRNGIMALIAALPHCLYLVLRHSQRQKEFAAFSRTSEGLLKATTALMNATTAALERSIADSTAFCGVLTEHTAQIHKSAAAPPSNCQLRLRTSVSAAAEGGTQDASSAARLLSKAAPSQHAALISFLSTLATTAAAPYIRPPPRPLPSKPKATPKHQRAPCVSPSSVLDTTFAPLHHAAGKHPPRGWLQRVSPPALLTNRPDFAHGAAFAAPVASASTRGSIAAENARLRAVGDEKAKRQEHAESMRCLQACAAAAREGGDPAALRAAIAEAQRHVVGFPAYAAAHDAAAHEPRNMSCCMAT